MTLQLILIFLLSLTLHPSGAYDIDQFSAAIVATGHGEPLTWYTPRVETAPIKGAPSGWRGATNCWPPVYSGVIYINPAHEPETIPMTVAHELVHLQTNCHGSETVTELAAMDAMAYLGRDADVAANLIRRLQPPRNLPDSIVKQYYTDVSYAMLYGDVQDEYPYMYAALVRIGVREDEYRGMK